MILNGKQIASATRGANRVVEGEDGFRFFRFSEDEERAYQGTSFEGKTASPAGVELVFHTDAAAVTLSVFVEKATTRGYFAFDVFSNGAYVGSLKNFEDGSLLCGYAGKPRPMGEFEQRFALGEGQKQVRVVLPWSVFVTVHRIELEDATAFEPVEAPAKKLLLYGDSITHGYDALHPSGSYAARLTRALGCEGFNKAIGGEMFRPALGEADSGVKADIVTVAYGTNDWNKLDADTFRANCRGFLSALCERQRDARIFVITPIWRSDEDEPPRPFGPFADVERIMREVCADLPVIVIRGYDFLPHDIATFGDTKLHPNLNGFDFYFHSLLSEIQKYI